MSGFVFPENDAPHYCHKPTHADKNAVWMCISCKTYWQAYEDFDAVNPYGRLRWRKVQDAAGTPFPPTKEEHREYMVWCVIAACLVILIIVFGYIF